MPSTEELDARRKSLNKMREMTPEQRESYVEGIRDAAKYVDVIYWYLKERSTKEGPTYYKTVWEKDKNGLSSAIHDLSALFSVMDYAKGKM